jgi:hypothetical protein
MPFVLKHNISPIRPIYRSSLLPSSNTVRRIVRRRFINLRPEKIDFGVIFEELEYQNPDRVLNPVRVSLD